MKVNLEIANTAEIKSLDVIKGLLVNLIDDLKTIIGSVKSFRFGFKLIIPSGLFFSVLEEDGSQSYIESGNFFLNAMGTIVDKTGKKLLPEITIPMDCEDIAISPSGIVTANPDATNPQQLGQIQVTMFTNPAGLQDNGSGYFTQTMESGAPVVQNPVDLLYSKDSEADVAYPIIIEKEVTI